MDKGTDEPVIVSRIEASESFDEQISTESLVGGKVMPVYGG